MSSDRKPEWLKIKYISNRNTGEVDDILKRYGLNTVCDEAMCPNKGECFSRRTATFMILGKNCTRNCTFCGVSKGALEVPDPHGPEKIAMAVKELGLLYIVITSVTRDDLCDGGASVFAGCIEEIRKSDDGIKVEVLIPDFQGDPDALTAVVKARPYILNHNIETVKRLYPEVRPQAVYKRSLELLRRVREMDPEMLTKSGMMLGLGEERNEVLETFADLLSCGVELLTVGQYLAPSGSHHKVVRYVHPDEFEDYRKIALDMGFAYVASAPFVRSSYNAAEAYNILQNRSV
jgi:lipoyl synthase